MKVANNMKVIMEETPVSAKDPVVVFGDDAPKTKATCIDASDVSVGRVDTAPGISVVEIGVTLNVVVSTTSMLVELIVLPGVDI